MAGAWHGWCAAGNTGTWHGGVQRGAGGLRSEELSGATRVVFGGASSGDNRGKKEERNRYMGA